uniref:Transmembrane protein n=1 Tax=Cacopsylla melanoneura TaxID=428564 RepID=A0A8D8S6S3_9HEMI
MHVFVATSLRLVRFELFPIVEHTFWSCIRSCPIPFFDWWRGWGGLSRSHRPFIRALVNIRVLVPTLFTAATIVLTWVTEDFVFKSGHCGGYGMHVITDEGIVFKC